MKGRVIFMTFILIILFIIFNYNVFLGNYYFSEANKQYLSNNFTGALDGYNKTLDYIKGEKIDFNKANTYYRIGENKDNINEKITDYETSLGLYSNILEYAKKNNKSEDKDVRYNYEFVKQKLEELKQKQEKEQEKNQDQEKEAGEDNKEKDEKEQKSEDKNNDEGVKNNNEDNEESDEGQPKKTSDGGKEQKQVELSQQELEQIEQYIEKLKEEEKYNREYLNNIKPIERNPFFDNIFDMGGEKDW